LHVCVELFTFSVVQRKMDVVAEADRVET